MPEREDLGRWPHKLVTVTPGSTSATSAFPLSHQGFHHQQDGTTGISVDRELTQLHSNKDGVRGQAVNHDGEGSYWSQSVYVTGDPAGSTKPWQ